jgi:lipid-binding SYLF domain-containing protein
MKKFFLLGLAALITLATPATYGADQRKDYVKRIESCEAILREFMADQAYAIPPAVLQKARGIIITNQFKAGFILGVTGGYGVIMVKQQNNEWSLPVMLDCGEMSLGLQLGGKAIETVFVLTDDETPRKLFSGRVNVGVDAKAVMGPKWAEMESVNKEILETPVLVYTKAKGLFAGATVKAGFLTRDDNANQRFYNTTYTLPELLYGNFIKAPAEVDPLMKYVAEIAH